MPRTSTLVAIAALPLLAAAPAPTTPPAAPTTQAEPTPPPVQWTGPDGNIKEHGFHRIHTPEAWRELWQQHAEDRAHRAQQGWVMPPEIDFDRYMIIACFRGPSQRNNGERASETLHEGDTLVVRFDSITFQTAHFGDNPPQDPTTHPFGIWLLPRHEGPIRIEEDRNRIIGADPIWREAHHFPPAPGAG